MRNVNLAFLGKRVILAVDEKSNSRRNRRKSQYQISSPFCHSLTGCCQKAPNSCSSQRFPSAPHPPQVQALQSSPELLRQASTRPGLCWYYSFWLMCSFFQYFFYWKASTLALTPSVPRLPTLSLVTLSFSFAFSCTTRRAGYQWQQG